MTISENNISEIMIVKASGERAPFDPHRLKGSLERSGAPSDIIKVIVSDIQAWIKPDITTKKIYSRAFEMLKRKTRAAALRYSLKEAIFRLGPTGYPFEKFIGHIFEKQGYSVQTGIVVAGKLITHEMDVVATGKGVQHLVECKYRQDQGKHINIQVPLYVRSRVNDIAELRASQPEFQGLDFIGWVVTNTRFSSDSTQYGEGSGLKLLAWDYPKQHGIKDLIKDLNIYPVTILSMLTEDEIQYIIEQGVVTCAGLQKHLELVNRLDIPDDRRADLLKEIKHICQER